MKRLSMIMVCVLAMMAACLSAKAQEVTITLIPGWTWVSCPATEAMDFATALGDFTPMQGDVIKSQWGQATYINGQWRGSISQFYPGYGYMYKSNRTMPVTVTFNAQQSTPQVVVTTSEPMLITAISAMCGGEVTVNDGTYILVKGLCWAMHENPTTNDDFYQEAESGVGGFSISMTGLNISTTYYVRAYAVTANGTVYGDQKIFTTRDGISVVTTAEMAEIGYFTAIGGGMVIDDGGLTVADRGLCWDTVSNPTLNNNHANDGTGLGEFTVQMSGLMANTTYHVRAYAINSYGTSYGSEVVFTTEQIPNYTITVSSNPSNGGTVTGGNIYQQGQYCTVSATSNNGYIFANWTENGDVVSTKSVYRFLVNSNRALVANYIEQIHWPNGELQGNFSVSSTKQVIFSQGNLQYIGSANTPFWKFADAQWEHFGSSGQNSNDQNADRDLFGWGTSGWNNGNVYYQPFNIEYLTTFNANEFGYGYGPTDGTNYQNNLTGIYANADWGVFNAISNGGNVTNIWRTLSIDEWSYLLYYRTTSTGIRFAKAKVNNINGLILLPDDWDEDYYSLNSLNDGNANYNDNLISVTQWFFLEQHGAVFLPNSGFRLGNTIYNIGQGYYWSASASGRGGARYLYLSSGISTNRGNSNERCLGYSVRLVKDVE